MRRSIGPPEGKRNAGRYEFWGRGGAPGSEGERPGSGAEGAAVVEGRVSVAARIERGGGRQQELVHAEPNGRRYGWGPGQIEAEPALRLALGGGRERDEGPLSVDAPVFRVHRLAIHELDD